MLELRRAVRPRRLNMLTNFWLQHSWSASLCLLPRSHMCGFPPRETSGCRRVLVSFCVHWSFTITNGRQAQSAYQESPELFRKTCSFHSNFFILICCRLKCFCGAFFCSSTCQSQYCQQRLTRAGWLDWTLPTNFKGMLVFPPLLLWSCNQSVPPGKKISGLPVC